MSIKHRLYISNALMFILPIVLVGAMGALTYLAFSSITGYNMDSYRQERILTTNESTVADYLEESDFEFIGKGSDLYRSPTEGYLIVTPDRYEVPVYDYANTSNPLFPLIPFTLILIVVIIINSLLTRYIFRSIMDPIKVLTHGVHEIRDGNLDYRIAYKGNDEFAPICGDFNEMAVHLSDMVEQRQQDERTRRELIAGISHDLRTPLTAVKAYIEGLEKGVAATPQMQRQYLDTIKDKTESIEHIINQLFAFSKIDIGDFPLNNEVVDIVSELESIVEDYACARKEQGDSISFVGPAMSVHCLLDVVQFETIVHNVLDNSLKYKIKDTAHVEVSCTVQGNQAEITFLDDGPGVPEETLEKLFELFYRTDSSRQNPEEGSGIGLAISQKIIERFGGTISAENVQDGGLRIRISLPLSTGETHD